MNGLLVIDNFLPDPNLVRKQALTYDYFNNSESDSTFPGKRTKIINDINPEYNVAMFNKLTKLIYNITESSYSVDLKSQFQLVSKAYGRGWVHHDTDADIAGVLYLNPNPPVDSGTEFYKLKNESSGLIDYTETKKQFVLNAITYEQAEDSLNKHNQQYELTDYISNKYNRLILYPGNWLHCAKNYFGHTDEDSRLTQVFFIKCIGHNAEQKYFLDKIRFT
jgi:hypothetical protein